MIPTKICGITNLSDAQCALENGTSAIGFIFYEKSPRAISIENAKIISDQITGEISRIGVFVNHEKDFIDEAISEVPLNMIQLHGDESPEFCNQFDVPVIKALRIKDDASLSIMDQYKVDGFLLDTFSKDHYGGTGETFDWSLLNKKSNTPIILSGGLNPENILDAISAVNPSAVDINSGVESSPGLKDHSKIEQLFNQLKKTFSSVQEFKYSRTH
ncbi:MAG: phosphoribosylanthranilate isomerase [Candidatus Marinimicrobia bacterium]|jgi:phosphoribosylanthranilate isomerase|nr:phosphoribosylanthranilate isomerase [Candidatus Neomarinimicrobiota bacterium]MBT4177002.1 phosphoribosylanthranilate isomerase [Candidatus Neomarinimicrobiota bacterium]MBT6000893.1 phosphoribosylanthranilate isomerase [Candidatus Neomarinimicrobiota bacterium]MBT6130538.1 phosphoribosylanthranilate isomerase [Candidatus Neomarinimicrobiota bacterium]MBT6915420.1 phosphoribosylanthranilate isomerase [Candidatus Neomarinimicrobiota bacterium]